MSADMDLIETLQKRYGLTFMGSQKSLQHFARDWTFLTTPDAAPVGSMSATPELPPLTPDEIREALGAELTMPKLPAVPNIGATSVQILWVLDRWARAYGAACAAAERERICNALPGGHSVDPQWVADMIRARGGR